MKRVKAPGLASKIGTGSERAEPGQKASSGGPPGWLAQLFKLAKAGKRFHVEASVVTYRLRIEIPHGEWMEIWASAKRPFEVGCAEKLVRIGECVSRLNSSDRANEPFGPLPGRPGIASGVANRGKRLNHEPSEC